MIYTDGSSKKIRSGLNTRALLDIIHEFATTEELKGYVQDIIDHVGKNRYRGGKRLLELAEFARREAVEAGDTATIERLDDLVGHATGRILSYDLERKYQMLEDIDISTRERNINAIELMLPNAYQLALAEVEQYFAEHPDATRTNLVNHLREMSSLSLKVVESREQGHYRILRFETESQVWLAEIIARRLELPKTQRRPTHNSDRNLDPSGAEFSLLVEAAHLQLRKKKLDDIRDVIENPYSKEKHIQNAIRGAYWLFGGSYIGEAIRRRFTAYTEVDIPLLRPDGSLHVVELKRANVSIVKRYRSGIITRSCVHEATSQVSNYLRTFDEDRGEILELHGLDTRRATGTVVIGHPAFEPEFTEDAISETLRTYNGERSRISVITYKELLDNAARTIDLATPVDPDASDDL